MFLVLLLSRAWSLSCARSFLVVFYLLQHPKHIQYEQSRPCAYELNLFAGSPICHIPIQCETLLRKSIAVGIVSAGSKRNSILSA